MASDLNAGFKNNANIITVRTMGTATQKITDRSIDLDGDGEEEEISITHVSGHAEGTPSSPGGKKQDNVVTPAGFKNTVVEIPVDTDGGVSKHVGDEYTEDVD